MKVKIKQNLVDLLVAQKKGKNSKSKIGLLNPMPGPAVRNLEGQAWKRPEEEEDKTHGQRL